jgi:hypothetical protein
MRHEHPQVAPRISLPRSGRPLDNPVGRVQEMATQGLKERGAGLRRGWAVDWAMGRSGAFSKLRGRRKKGNPFGEEHVISL